MQVVKNHRIKNQAKHKSLLKEKIMLRFMTEFGLNSQYALHHFSSTQIEKINSEVNQAYVGFIERKDYSQAALMDHERKLRE